MSPTAAALLGLAVLVGSSIPFVPTGELVSAAAALTTGSVTDALVVYVVALTASLLGDTAMLAGIRLTERFAAPLVPQRSRAWLARRTAGPSLQKVRDGVTGRAFQAVLVGRLVPGGRAPVIIALGLAHHPLRRFMAIDVVACALWAAVYVAMGTAGSHLPGPPLLGTVIAVASAVGLGLTVQLARMIHDRSRGTARQ